MSIICFSLHTYTKLILLPLSFVTLELLTTNFDSYFTLPYIKICQYGTDLSNIILDINKAIKTYYEYIKSLAKGLVTCAFPCAVALAKYLLLSIDKSIIEVIVCAVAYHFSEEQNLFNNGLS